MSYSMSTVASPVDGSYSRDIDRVIPEAQSAVSAAYPGYDTMVILSIGVSIIWWVFSIVAPTEVSMHLINYVLIGAVLLLLFGSKQLQSLARNAGKATGELRQAKDRLMADPSLEEVMNMKKSLDRLPTTPEKAVRMMLTPADKPPVKSTTTGAASDEKQ